MARSLEIGNSCPMEKALNILSGKWKLQILWRLSIKERRFNELKSELHNISSKSLTVQLRELEEDNMIERVVIAESPIKVEYHITEIGNSLTPFFKSLCEWGKYYKEVTSVQ